MRPLLAHTRPLLATAISQRADVRALIAASDHWAVWAVIATCAASGQQLEKTRVGRALSGPVCAMALAAILTNAHILPVPSAEFRLGQAAIVKLCTPLLLLSADLRRILGSTGRLLPVFFAGSLGTSLGALIGAALLAPQLATVPGGIACAAALAAKNIGSGINFIAVCQTLSVPADTVAAALSVDNVGALLYFPLLSVLGSRVPPEDAKPPPPSEPTSAALEAAAPADASGLQMAGTALAIALSLCALADRIGPPGAALPVVTVLTVALATIGARVIAPVLPAAQSVGSTMLYLFFATAGASGGVAPAVCMPLALFTATLYAVHLGVLLCCARVARWPLENALVSSSANIGGPATASSLAASRGWQSLVTPAILCGTLGNCMASFIGLGLYRLMLSLPGATL
jgi:uncharacterized membrane protein